MMKWSRASLLGLAALAAVAVAGDGVMAQTDTAPKQTRRKPATLPAQPPAAPEQPAQPAAKAVNPRGPEQEYQECLKLWDAATHMSRSEWAATCRRIQNRLNDITAQSEQISATRRRAR